MRVARALSALGPAVGLAALANLGVAGPARAQPAEPTVRVLDNFFDPAAVTVVVGTTVRWTWAGANPHTVSARDGSFRSPQQTQGDYSQTFRVAGQVDYFCEVHGMSGSVTVQASPPPSPTPAATSARPTPSPTSARPAPPPSPSPAATTPAPLPSPTTAAPSPSPSPTPRATTASASPSASPGKSVVPPTATSSPLVLGSLDEPRPKDRTGLAIALGLLVGGVGIGLGATLLLRGRPRKLRADEPLS